MTTIYHPEHPHYAVHKAYVEGCFANPDNPPVLQFLCSDGNWVASGDSFFIDFKYRIKPRTHWEEDRDSKVGKLPRHKFWGAGELDCPKDIKASNGELHTMRCKVCCDNWRKSVDVCFGATTPTEGSQS